MNQTGQFFISTAVRVGRFDKYFYRLLVSPGSDVVSVVVSIVTVVSVGSSVTPVGSGVPVVSVVKTTVLVVEAGDGTTFGGNEWI